jgi:phosphoglycerate dehydrogenase-like enzyme
MGLIDALKSKKLEAALDAFDLTLPSDHPLLSVDEK